MMRPWPLPSAWRAALVLAVLGAASIIGWHLWPSTEARRALVAGAFTPIEGHAYEYYLAGAGRFVSSGGDSAGAPNASGLRLYEDGRELGPSHSLHKNVAAGGAGRYSHWGDRLVLSASDNSDPRTSGRRYEVTYSLAPARWLVLGSGALLAAIAAAAAWALLRERASARAWWIVPPALLVLASLATATHWVPIGGAIDVDPARLPAQSAIGVHSSGARPGVVKLIPFERLVGPFRIVPSPPPETRAGPIAVKHRAAALRETFDLDGFLAVQDASFLDADRIGGDGILVYLPRAAADAPLTIEYASTVTGDAAGFLWSAFALSVLTALVARRARSRAPRERILLAAATAAGGTGLALLGLNAIGLFVPMRPADPRIAFPNGEYSVEAAGSWKSPEALERELVPRPGEDNGAYALRANDVVAAHVKHVWNYANATYLGLHVPPWSNFVLWALGETSPALYRYHYAAWRPALERSVGMCSQVTLILVGILRDRGLDARIAQLSGHTVVTAEVAPGTWYVLDPDIGVAFRQSLAAIERDPDVVRPSYRERYTALGHPDPTFAAGVIAGFYNREGNYVEPRGGNEMFGELWGTRETLARVMKWLIPIALLALAGLLAAAATGRRPKGARG